MRLQSRAGGVRPPPPLMRSQGQSRMRSQPVAMNSRRLIQSMTLETIAPLSDDPSATNAGAARGCRQGSFAKQGLEYPVFHP